MAKRAGQKRGWKTIACTLYGQVTTKTYKTFLATYSPARGMIRVVLVKEDHGWLAFYCTDTSASVKEILEAFAGRATIEQIFHDVKEVWGAGQQQVCNIWTNLAVYNLNLWMHALVEIWAWNQPHENFVIDPIPLGMTPSAVRRTRIVAEPCDTTSCKLNYRRLPTHGTCHEK